MIVQLIHVTLIQELIWYKFYDIFKRFIYNFWRLKRNQSVYSENYERPSMTRLGLDDNSLQITSFNQYGFTINQHINTLGPILIFPKTIFSWNIDDVKDINEKSLLLFKLIQPRVDVLIIGYGDKHDKVSPDVPKWLLQNNIRNFEILPTVNWILKNKYFFVFFFKFYFLFNLRIKQFQRLTFW